MELEPGGLAGRRGWSWGGGDQGWYVEAWLPLGFFDLQNKSIKRWLVCVGQGWGGVGESHLLWEEGGQDDI